MTTQPTPIELPPAVQEVLRMARFGAHPLREDAIKYDEGLAEIRAMAEKIKELEDTGEVEAEVIRRLEAQLNTTNEHVRILRDAVEYFVRWGKSLNDVVGYKPMLGVWDKYEEILTKTAPKL